jgi:fimbrial chaperone protein
MRLRLLVAALLALLVAPVPAMASKFVVTPTEVDLSTSTTSALLTLRNASNAALRFEITLFAWSEDERGAMMLQPSTDVTFFPKLIELAPGASRNIRLGIKAGASRDVEQSYRIFVEELPDQSAPSANVVAIRTKVGIPVFVRPAKPARSAVIDGVSVAGGKVLTRVRNVGNLHVSVDAITVKGIGPSSAPTFSKEGAGWYVLPGATRIFELPMSASECQSTATVVVEVLGHNKSLKGASAVSPAACVAP